MPAAFASSSILETPDHPRFDLIATVQEAIKNNFSAVQLFINSSVMTEDYCSKLIDLISQTDLKVVVHLPNLDKYTQADEWICLRLAYSLHAHDLRFLIHYEDGMNIRQVPIIGGQPVMIENSATGKFDPDHVMQAFQLARNLQTGFVFDHGRIMYANSAAEQEEVVAFVCHIINQLDPSKDVIHTADKTSWTERYKDAWAALGDPEGISAPIIPYLRSFADRGGIVVFEHENPEDSIRSKDVFQRP